jgi:hypothetical protein
LIVSRSRTGFFLSGSGLLAARAEWQEVFFLRRPGQKQQPIQIQNQTGPPVFWSLAFSDALPLLLVPLLRLALLLLLEQQQQRRRRRQQPQQQQQLSP